jgi:hypothetical protein
VQFVENYRSSQNFKANFLQRIKKYAIFFAENWQKLQKIVIITSVPGHPVFNGNFQRNETEISFKPNTKFNLGENKNKNKNNFAPKIEQFELMNGYRDFLRVRKKTFEKAPGHD